MKMNTESSGTSSGGSLESGPEKARQADTKEAVQAILADLEAFLEHDDELVLRVSKTGFGMTALKHGGTRHALFLSLVFSRLAMDLLLKETAAQGGDQEIITLALAVYTAKAAALNFGAARQEDVHSMAEFKAIMKKLKPEA